MSSNAISVCLEGKRSFIQVDGKGSFQNSPELKIFANEMINRGVRDFVLDLEECPVMDSTFMGTLQGIAQRLLGMGQGQMTVINLNERNMDLLVNLGLNHFMEVHEDDGGIKASDTRVCAEQPLESPELTKEERAELMLAAHENLAEISPENQRLLRTSLSICDRISMWRCARATGVGVNSRCRP